MFRTPIALFFLLLPLLEIAGFVIVGSHIGALATVALVIASGLLGAVLLRVQGFGALRRAQIEAATGGTPDREIVHGAMILVAGILLMIPGFLTDIIGLLLFLPPVRDLFWRWIRARMVVVTGSARRPGPGDPRIIDLDADDYSDVSKKDSPWSGPRVSPPERRQT